MSFLSRIFLPEPPIPPAVPPPEAPTAATPAPAAAPSTGWPFAFSDSGQHLVKDFEGYRNVAYRCPAGVWTVGWGSTHGVTAGMVVTVSRAQAMFDADTAQVVRDVNAAVADCATTQGQFDAMVSFSYNLGSGALRSSDLLKLHRAGDFAAAAAQFVLWDKAHVNGILVELAGLKRRRLAEAAVYGEQS